MHLKLDKSKWQKVQFGDVVKKVNNKIDPNEYGSDVVIQGGHINKRDFHIREYENKKELGYLGPAFHMGFKKGQILYVSRNPHLMKVGYPHFDGICANTTFIMETKNEDILSNDLIPFIMHSDTFIEQSVANVRGGVNPYVNWGDLACIEFLLPPKDQQAKIAELLWAMDDVIEREIEVHDKLVITKKTVSKAKIDFGYNSKSKTLPSNWRMMKINEFSEVKAGSTPLRSNKDFFENGKFPWIKTLDLNNDKIYGSEECITQLALDKSSCKMRAKGTVLVAMYGGFNQIGRTGLLEIEAATNQAISAVMVDKDVIIPEFLLLVLNTKIDYWKKVAISSRKDPNITKDDVENFPVSIPPLHEQRDILLKSNSTLDSIQKLDSKISKSKSLQKSLINQVF